MSYTYEPGRAEADDILGMSDAEAEAALRTELVDFTVNAVEHLVMVPRREHAVAR
jgi:hypothetical protein